MFYNHKLKFARRFGPEIAIGAGLAASQTAAAAGAATAGLGAVAAPTALAAGAGATATAATGLTATQGIMLAGLGLGALTAGVGGFGAYQQAQAQNEYMGDAYDAQAAAIGSQNRMIRAQETLESRKAISQSRLVQSRIRALAGESGLGTGGTYEALLRQTDYDTALNLGVIHENASNSFLAAASNMQPIQGRTINPLLDGLSSGLGGFQTGLSIGDSFERLNRRAV